MKRISIRPPLFFVVAILMLTMIVGPWGQFVTPVYAEGEGDFGKICFDGDKDYEWAHFYNVDSVNDSLSLDDLNITVLNGDGSEKDADSYDLSVEHVYYSEEEGREVGDPVETPFGIWEGDEGEGFTQYRAIAASKENSEVWCEGNFYVMDKHSLAFVCADIGVEPGTATWYEDWRMHHRYWFNPGTDINFVVKHTGVDVALTEDTDYKVEYYRVARPEDMDNEDVAFEDIIVPDAEFLVTDEGQPAQPTEPGSYFARITGINDYYGENDVLVDIDSIPRIVFRSGGEHELWSDGDLKYEVDIPDGVDGDLWIGVGVRGEDRWEVLFNDEQNPAEFFEYNDQSGELTLHGDAIFEAIGDRVVNIYASITKEGEEDNLLAEGFADADVREAKYEYDLPEDDALLPEWTGWIDNKFHVYIENKQYPEGRDWDLTVTDVTIKNVDPAGAITLGARDDGWEYRAETQGSATITLEYEDVDGTAKEHSFEVVAGEHVYRADFWPTEGINQGLPGTSIELQADAEHNFIRYDEEDHNNWWHDSTREGLVYHWNIIRGNEFATITPNANDPTKATLTFNDLPERWESIGEQIDVKLSVTDTNTGDPTEERAVEQKDFWVCSDYTQIMPALIDSSLDVGKSTTIEPELRHYQYGKDGYKVIENARFEIEEYDPNAIDVVENDGVFTITRKADWDTNFNIKAYFSWGYGRDDERDQWYHLDRKNYDISFEYDEFEIYDDQTLTVKLNKENLEGLREELEDPSNEKYQLKYTVGKWNDQTEDWDKVISEDKYTANLDGITISGETIKEEGLDGVNIQAEILIDGESFGGENYRRDTWCWLALRESCKDEHKWLKAPASLATCEKGGKEVWICLDHPEWGGCGKVRFVDTDPLGHNIVKVAAKDSTLTATGNKEHYKCSRCGKLFSDAAGTKQITAASVVIAKKINISGATVAAIPNKTFNNKAQTPAPTVKYGSTTLKSGTDYTVSYKANTNAGKATVTVTGKGKYAGTKTATFTIVKAANPIKLTAKKPTVKYAALSKKNQAVKQTAVCTVSGAQGKVTWKKASGNAKITVASNGNITVKKGLKKGSYKVKLNATAAGNSNYNKATKSVTVTIAVK